MATNTIRNRSGTARAHTHRRTAHIRGIRERLRAPCRSRLSCTAMEKAIHLRKNNNKTNNPEKRMKLVKWLGKKTDTKNEQTSNENTHNWMLSRFPFFFLLRQSVRFNVQIWRRRERKNNAKSKQTMNWIAQWPGRRSNAFSVFFFNFLFFVSVVFRLSLYFD